VLRSDGTAWTQVEVPDEQIGVLTGVAAIAPNDVWVVGHAGDPEAGLERSVILHWDGRLWADVDPGRATGTGTSALLGVEAVAPDDVWAVGSLHSRPLTIHFDGERWSRVESDVRGVANAISPVTPTDVWAVGSPIQHYDGAWAAAAEVRADGELFGVAAVGPSDVWAVGVRPAERPARVRGDAACRAVDRGRRPVDPRLGRAHRGRRAPGRHGARRRLQGRRGRPAHAHRRRDDVPAGTLMPATTAHPCRPRPGDR
jgi:hypothetical protein